MLASFFIYLRPHQPTRMSGHMGRAIHGLFFRLLSEVDPALATALHTEGLKPFTLSVCKGTFQQQQGEPYAVPEEVYRVRYSVLREDLFQALGQVLLTHVVEGKTIFLHEAPFDLVRIGLAPHEKSRWLGTTTYEELYGARRAEREITLQFASPTAFKSGTLHLLFPQPYNVFGSLRRTWEAFSDIPLSEELMTFVDAHVTVSRYSLETRMIMAGTYQLLGFVGRCTYRILGGAEAPVRDLNALAEFALFAGVGMKSTQGMGETRRVSSQEERSRLERPPRRT